ncbi:unnamed protein product, partial [Mesorhabditis belari]|uniref:Uncharacterized protein n=1 Tax=Mesorhabditis belari TaxID=2138241 RepID=A0AAF3EZH2_9BILA
MITDAEGEMSEAERRRLFKNGLKTSTYLRNASEMLAEAGLPSCLAGHFSIRSKQAFFDVQSLAASSTSSLNTNLEMAYLDLEIKDRCKRCWMNLRKSGAYKTHIQTPKKQDDPKRKTRLLATCAYCGQTMVCKSAQFEKNLAYPKRRHSKKPVTREPLDMESISITAFNSTSSPTATSPALKDKSFSSNSSRRKKKASKLASLVAEEEKTTQSSLSSFLNSL